jgi:hypothetical protein
MTMKIEDGVPVPPRGRPSNNAELIKVFEKMQPGQSVLTPQGLSRNRVVGVASRIFGAGNYSVSAQSSGSLRVWRIR